MIRRQFRFRRLSPAAARRIADLSLGYDRHVSSVCGDDIVSLAEHFIRVGQNPVVTEISSWSYDEIFELEVLVLFGRDYKIYGKGNSIDDTYTDLECYEGRPDGKNIAIEYVSGKPLHEYIPTALTLLTKQPWRWSA